MEIGGMNKSEGHGRTMARARVARQWEPDTAVASGATYAVF
ncbi:hypothetical protein SJ05684_c09170 [Sinorhizobium sojae CCBAU 05684]|uniref:Uncharacterized protein n=1 Tax=Sinorhizobium sojae CCBAU 05684 TaxID=716928 RepID=A0A249PAR0_9HYPH|nr:hypothetical protein SJ05684_c09170 [Sinorhizobium sojae CCBAU 05684]